MLLFVKVSKNLLDHEKHHAENSKEKTRFASGSSFVFGKAVRGQSRLAPHA